MAAAKRAREDALQKKRANLSAPTASTADAGGNGGAVKAPDQQEEEKEGEKEEKESGGAPVDALAALQMAYGVTAGSALFRDWVWRPQVHLQTTARALAEAVEERYLPRLYASFSGSSMESAADFDIHVQLYPSTDPAMSGSGSKGVSASSSSAAGAFRGVGSKRNLRLCACVVIRRRRALQRLEEERAALEARFLSAAAVGETLESALGFWRTVSWGDHPKGRLRQFRPLGLTPSALAQQQQEEERAEERGGEAGASAYSTGQLRRAPRRTSSADSLPSPQSATARRHRKHPRRPHGLSRPAQSARRRRGDGQSASEVTHRTSETGSVREGDAERDASATSTSSEEEDDDLSDAPSEADEEDVEEEETKPPTCVLGSWHSVAQHRLRTVPAQARSSAVLLDRLRRQFEKESLGTSRCPSSCGGWCQPDVLLCTTGAGLGSTGTTFGGGRSSNSVATAINGSVSSTPSHRARGRRVGGMSTAGTSTSSSSTAERGRLRQSTCGLAAVLYVTVDGMVYTGYPSSSSGSNARGAASAPLPQTVLNTTVPRAAEISDDVPHLSLVVETPTEAGTEPTVRTAVSERKEEVRPLPTAVWPLALDSSASFTRGLLGL